MVDLNIGNATLFFDLAGTLMPRTGYPSSEQCAILSAVAAVARRFVLVTGQSADDPQVEFLSRCVGQRPDVEFVAYTSRGGRRWTCGEGLHGDDSYLTWARLTAADAAEIRGMAMHGASRHHLAFTELPKLVDDCAIRARVHQSETQRAVRVLSESICGYQVVTEGRSSIFVMRKGVEKAVAVRHELSVIGNSAVGLYFGNEVEEGNDRSVVTVEGLRVYAIGGCGLPSVAVCASIGASIADLYDALAQAVAHARGAARRNSPAGTAG
jgi:hypothetical protein